MMTPEEYMNKVRAEIAEIPGGPERFAEWFFGNQSLTLNSAEEAKFYEYIRAVRQYATWKAFNL